MRRSPTGRSIHAPTPRRHAGAGAITIAGRNINSRDVSDPLILVPSLELKVVPGPFRADLQHRGRRVVWGGRAVVRFYEGARVNRLLVGLTAVQFDKVDQRQSVRRLAVVFGLGKQGALVGFRHSRS